MPNTPYEGFGGNVDENRDDNDHYLQARLVEERTAANEMAELLQKCQEAIEYKTAHSNGALHFELEKVIAAHRARRATK